MNKTKLVLNNATQAFGYSSNNNVLSDAMIHSVGYCDGEYNRMYMQVNLSALPRGAKVTKATLTVAQTLATLNNSQSVMAVYQVPSALQSGSTPPQHNDKMLDYVRLTDVPQEGESGVTYSFDVTTLLHNVTQENQTAYLVLKLADETVQENNYVTLYSPANLDTDPYLEIEYVPNFDGSMNEATHTHSLGRFGTVGIDLKNGNMLMESEDFGWAGNRMPVTLKHLYTGVLAGEPFTNNANIGLHTADFSAMKVGHGWRMNVMQSIVPAEILHQDQPVNGYLYMDEWGYQISLVQSEAQEDKRTDEQGNEYFLFVSTQDATLKYDALKQELYEGDNTLTFDASGRFIQVKDQYGNQQTIQYANGQIDCVSDGIGRNFDFTYENGFLAKVTAPDGTFVSYEYTAQNLSAITYPDGRKACIAYNANSQPVCIELKDNDGALVYRTEYTYENNRVTSVKEFGCDSQMG